MLPKFVATSNVKRFIHAIGKIDNRTAREAGIILAHGAAGHGKTKTGEWWAVQNNAIFIRLKAKATPAWMLRDILTELGEGSTANRCETLLNQVVGILARDPQPIVVDEVENGLGANIKVLQTLRDICDLCELPVVFIGREWVRSTLKRYEEFKTRIADEVAFEALTLGDVQLLSDQLLKCRLAPDLVKAVHDQTQGRMREIIKALGVIELAHGNKGAPITVADMTGAGASAKAA